METNPTNINNLKTVKNYALAENVTPSYLYTLAKKGKMELIVIDGVYFVDTKKNPHLPTRNK